MRITRIRLTDVRCHAGLDVQPAAGLTVVRGPNEAGKTTLHEAIRLALFRKADSNRDDTRNLQRWGATGPPTIELDLELDGREARLRKRFGGPRAESRLELEGQAITDPALIAEHLCEATGIPSEAFFRATACVGHAELVQVAQTEEPAISDRLQKAISGADRGTGRAKQKLELVIHGYRKEGPKNPGLLKSVRGEIATLTDELARGEQALAALEADRGRLAEARARRVELDAQLAQQQAELADAQRAEQLVVQHDEAQARYVKLRRAAELVAEVEALDQATPTAIPLATLRSSVARASALQLELSELEADLDAGATAVVEEEPAPEAPPSAVRWFIAAAALLAGAAGALLVLDGLLEMVLVVVLAAVGSALLLLGVRDASRRHRHSLAMALAQNAAVARARADSDLQERHRRRRRELELVLAELGVADVEAAESLLAATEQHTARLDVVAAELRGLGVEERGVRRLEEERDRAANAAERASHALAGMGRPAHEVVAARQVAQRAVERTSPARDQARSEEDQLTGRVDANHVDAELVAAAEERLRAAQTREAELLRRVAVYEATRAAIVAAEQATLKTAARYLEEHMGPAVARITGGRYEQVKVDERNLAFRVRAPETGTLVNVERLSQGTRDQLYLAARLGLVRLVTMDRRPPLILDDPFVTFDEQRAAQALAMLKELAAELGFQVILLTCSDRFDALADALVVLDAPRSERLVVESLEAWPEEPALAAVRNATPSGDGAAAGEPGDSAAADAAAEPSIPGAADPRTGIVDPFRLGG